MAKEKNGNGKRDKDNPEFRNFQQLLKQVVPVSKEKIDEQLAERRREKGQKRAH